MIEPSRALLEALIERPSVTPDDAGCLGLVRARPADGRVGNLWATHRGTRLGPTLVLAGHTDVVPSGALAAWTSRPFEPQQRGEHLHRASTIETWLR